MPRSGEQCATSTWFLSDVLQELASGGTGYAVPPDAAAGSRDSKISCNANNREENRFEAFSNR
jgi:hypothetical protein